LDEEGLKALGVLLAKTAKRYHNQDLSDVMEEYLADLEQLAVRYSVQSVEEAIAELRVDPEQTFFPTPTEIAAKMKQLRLKRLPSHLYAQD
jgi:hypothetical protein